MTTDTQALKEAAGWHKEREMLIREEEKDLLKRFGRTQSSELLHREIVCHVGAANAIRALANMPPEYVVVKREEWEQAEANLLSRDKFIVDKDLWVEFVEQLPKATT
jgi:hypothetical protein